MLQIVLKSWWVEMPPRALMSIDLICRHWRQKVSFVLYYSNLLIR